MPKLQCFKIDKPKHLERARFLVVDLSGDRIFGFSVEPSYERIFNRLDEFCNYEGPDLELAIAELASKPEKVW